MPLGLAVRLLAAFLVLLGTSGQGFAAMLCATPLCPKTIAAKPTPVDAKSCCAKEAARDQAAASANQDGESGGRDCCCELKSVPTLVKLGSKLVHPTGIQVDLTLSEPLPTVDLAVAIEASNRITSYSDASPPDPGVLPDRGRAPPAP